MLTKRRVLRRWQEALVQWREEKEVADRKVRQQQAGTPSSCWQQLQDTCALVQR